MGPMARAAGCQAERRGDGFWVKPPRQPVDPRPGVCGRHPLDPGVAEFDASVMRHAARGARARDAALATMGGPLAWRSMQAHRPHPLDPS